MVKFSIREYDIVYNSPNLLTLDTLQAAILDQRNALYADRVTTVLSIPKIYSVYLCKFRLSNHKLSIETGRYNKTPRNLRYYDICNENVVGDEFHLLFECKNRLMCELRETFIPNLYKCNPSAFKFNHMMKNINSNNGVNLAKFLKLCKKSITCQYNSIFCFSNFSLYITL